jgi:hypothetical protein
MERAECVSLWKRLNTGHTTLSLEEAINMGFLDLKSKHETKEYDQQGDDSQSTIPWHGLTGEINERNWLKSEVYLQVPYSTEDEKEEEEQPLPLNKPKRKTITDEELDEFELVLSTNNNSTKRTKQNTK